MMRQCFAIFLSFFLNAQLFAIEHSSAIYAPITGSKQLISEKYFDIDSEIHPAWVHKIAAINKKADIITLEDGSEWKLAYWFSDSPTNTWELDDQITISWHGDSTYFLDIKLKNHTKKDYAWARLKETPQVNMPGFLYIEHIPNRMTLELSNGTRIFSKKTWMFNDFKEGDIIITLYNKESAYESSYDLWDTNAGRIAENLSLATVNASQEH